MTTETVSLAKEEATKKFVSLAKVAADKVAATSLGNQKAQVVGVLDISISMSGLFNSGVVQQVCERGLALALQFDDDGSIPVYPFGANNHPPVDLTEEEFFGFVDDQILKKFRLEGGTRYSGPLRRIVEDHFPGALTTGKKGFFGGSGPKVTRQPATDNPVFVQFWTDGDNQDERESEEIIRLASELPMFIQFIGIGNAGFSFLRRLDEMEGRFMDNVGFFHARDIANMSDSAFLDGMLNEFPDWVTAAKQKGLVI